jgi:transposase
MKVTLIGIDLAKSIFQVCGVNQAGRGRELQQQGFAVKLIPPQHVKPFVKGNKNDRNDAFAITEAARRPDLRGIEPRTLAQTDMIQVHRVLDRMVRQRTALINQIRGFLNEYGIVVSRGKEKLLSAIPDLLEDADNGLTSSSRALLQTLSDEWRQMNEAIDRVEEVLKHQAKTDEAAQRLMKIKGVAVKISTATIAHAGNGHGYQSGRHFAANLGLVPKEHSSGGKQQLAGITKRGNRYLRRLLIQGAWSVIRHADKNDDRMSRWARQLVERRGKHKAAVAVANKMARVMWSMLYHQTEYRAN